jgi:O-antigen ligase
MPADEIATALMKSFVWGACLIAIAGWIMPAESDLRLGNQDYFNANTIGNICAFGIYFAQYLIRRTHARLTLPAIFLALTLLRSLSKTTIAAFALSQAIFLIQDRAMSRKTKFWLTVGAACCVFFFWGLFEAYYDLYTTSGNQAETLTGRTAIWLYVVDAALQAPWVGHGFDSMWKIVPAFGTFEARHAENELLQQVYAFGATGAVLLCGIYASLYKTIRRIPFAAWRLPLSCLLLFVLVRGLAEADPFDLLMPLWCVALIAAIASEAALEPRSADIGPIHFRPKTVSHGLT